MSNKQKQNNTAAGASKANKHASATAPPPFQEESAEADIILTEGIILAFNINYY